VTCNEIFDQSYDFNENNKTFIQKHKVGEALVVVQID